MIISVTSAFVTGTPSSRVHLRHGCTFLRVRPDKLATDCLLEQVLNMPRSRA
jgi:hypothetical protein